jgi:CRP-like cAMP-binding protein
VLTSRTDSRSSIATSRNGHGAGGATVSAPAAQIPSDCHLIRELPTSARRDLTRTSKTRLMKRGEFFCRQGEPIGKLGVLTRGKLTVAVIGRAGDQSILRFIAPGGVFSFAHAVSGVSAVASIQAVQDSTILEWDAQTLERLMRRHPSITHNFATAVVEHTQEMWAHLHETLTEDSGHRLVSFLLRETSTRLHASRDLEIRVTAQQMAEYLGTTPYTVSRIMSRWRREGVVAISRGRVRVLAPEQLDIEGPDDKMH